MRLRVSQKRTHKLEDIEAAAFAVLNFQRGLSSNDHEKAFDSRYRLKPHSLGEGGSISGLNLVKSSRTVACV